MSCGCKKKKPVIHSNVKVIEAKTNTQTTQPDVQLTEQQQAQVNKIIFKINQLNS